MKTFNLIAKIVAALAAIAGAIYVIATYGEQIVAWCKKVMAMLPKCECDCECECEDCDCEEPCDDCKCHCTCEETTEAPVEEAVSEEPVEEVPVVEIAADEVVANEEDFEG